jgi:hypothetical protein
MTSAQLLDSGRAINVTLSTEAEATFVPCSYMFDAATLAKLGSVSICTTSGDKFLLINMIGTTTLVPGTDTLVLLADQATLVSKVGSKSFAGSIGGGSTNTPVATCTACPAPVAAINGPAVLSPPCSVEDAAVAPRYIFDGTSARDTSGRALTTAAWALTQGTSVALSDIITAANARAATSVR